jgi:hypothetical protein
MPLFVIYYTNNNVREGDNTNLCCRIPGAQLDAGDCINLILPVINVTHEREGRCILFLVSMSFVVLSWSFCGNCGQLWLFRIASM